MESYYQILRMLPEKIQGKEDAEVSQIIEAQYQALMVREREMHRSGVKRDEILKQVDEAREVLSNPEKRKAYDQQLKEMLEEDAIIEIEMLPEEVIEEGGLEPIREQEARGDYLAGEKAYFEKRLSAAIRQGKVDEVNELLNEVEGRKLFSNFSDGSTVLGLAVEYHHDQIFESLLKNIADVNARDRSGMTALGVAIDKSNVNLAKQLLNAGAKTEKVDGERNAVDYANMRLSDYQMREMLKQHEEVAQDKESVDESLANDIQQLFSQEQANNQPELQNEKRSRPGKNLPEKQKQIKETNEIKDRNAISDLMTDNKQNPIAPEPAQSQSLTTTQNVKPPASRVKRESKFVTDLTVDATVNLFNSWKQDNPDVKAKLTVNKGKVEIKIADPVERDKFTKLWRENKIIVSKNEYKELRKQNDNKPAPSLR